MFRTMGRIGAIDVVAFFSTSEIVSPKRVILRFLFADQIVSLTIAQALDLSSALERAAYEAGAMEQEYLGDPKRTPLL